MHKPSTPISTRTRTRSSAAASKQQSSLNPKVLGSAAAAHGKGRTALTKRRRCNSNDEHSNNTTVVSVSDPTPDVPVHDPILDDDVTYFEDAYAHFRVFKPKVPPVVPHPNANSKGEWMSIKGLFQDQAAKVTTVDQDSDKDHGFNDDDNDFADALNEELQNGDLDDVVSTAVHEAYQNGTINSVRPPIVGTSSIALGKRKRMYIEEETEESEAAAPSSTTIITSTNGTSVNANASSSSNTATTSTAAPTSMCMCTKCGCKGQNPIRNPVGHLDPPARRFGIKRGILDACAGRCNHMELADNLSIGMRLCVWNDAAEFNCLRCLGQSRTAVCLSRNINIPGPLPLIDCCPLVRSARRNRHLRNYLPKCYEPRCSVCPAPLQQKGPPIDPRCWTVVLERRRVDFYLRCQYARAGWHQQSFADSCKVMDKLSSKITRSYPITSVSAIMTLSN
ncbi:MAG: hypothetical protein J3R72DRAFT_475640 [Linnemannia gamsii]|nr:MAG: hypothetical protein J3R72DRAFT_475640 [Linnemannia gamsii]